MNFINMFNRKIKRLKKYINVVLNALNIIVFHFKKLLYIFYICEVIFFVEMHIVKVI